MCVRAWKCVISLLLSGFIGRYWLNGMLLDVTEWMGRYGLHRYSLVHVLVVFCLSSYWSGSIVWYSRKLAFTRPGSGTTKLDSGAQKRLRQSRVEGYWPRPQARTRLARAAVVPPPSSQASSRTGTAGHCAGQPASPVGTFSKAAILHCFPKSYILRIEIFRMFFYPFTSTYDPCEQWKVSLEIGPYVFEKSRTHTQTQQLFVYRSFTNIL